MFRKKISAVEGGPKKIWSGIVEWKEVWLGVSLMGIIRKEKGGLTFSLIERKKPVVGPALGTNQCSMCNPHSSRKQGGKRPNC